MSHVFHHQMCTCVWVYAKKYAKKCILDISLSFFFFFRILDFFVVGGFIIIIIIYFGCAGSSLFMVRSFNSVAHGLI